MNHENQEARVERLRETLAVIERMLTEQRNADYFEALRQKKAGRGTTNVTAAFFGSAF